MSTSIRPPGGPTATGPAELEQLSEAQAGQASSVTEAAPSARTALAQAPEVQNPAATVLSRLDRGEVTREQAIDTLVTEALEAHGADALPAAQRDELAAVLRSALLDDPTLSRMLGS